MNGINKLQQILTENFEATEDVNVELKDICSDESFEIITPIQEPKTSKWALNLIQMKSLTDADILWQIGFDSDISSLIMWSCQLGGVISVKYREVQAKSNRSLQQQALLEARHRYLLMVRKGYNQPGNHINNFKFMRAEDYMKENKPNPLKFPVTVEPKIDGIRIAITKKYGKVIGLSRGGVEFTTMQHLFIEASNIIDYLPLGSILDCEMYHPNFTLQQLGSITRTINTLHPLLSMLELHIFDIYLPDNPCYEERREILEKLLATYRFDFFNYQSEQVGGRHSDIADNRTIEEIKDLSINSHDKYLSLAIPEGKTKIFLTERYLAYNHDDIKKAHKYFTKVGYEGTMIKRQANGAQQASKDYKMSQYLNGKGRRILKYKDWSTDEGICLEVLDSKGTEKGCARLKVQNKEGHIFPVRPTGSFEIRKEWLKNPKLVVGKPITYKYQTLTDGGKPRHPVAIEVRDYEPGFNPMTE